ncbi:MAG: FAD binding domain-containing protein [Coriobacteriia bacterium]|nr:FAD binding domain-containing protein [Coriobacteriia bacterium]
MVASSQTRFAPESLAAALQLLAAETLPPLTPYAGGTDLMAKEGNNGPFVFLHKIPELKAFRAVGDVLHIGAGLTFSQLLRQPEAPAVLKEAIAQIAAPAVRNLATLGGNIANASPKADGALVAYAAEAKLLLASYRRGQRLVALTDFYLGRNKTIRRPDELIVEVQLPTAHLDGARFIKVGARAALAISRVSLAGLLALDDDGLVAHASLAFGAVGDVFIRYPELDGLFLGQSRATALLIVEQYLERLAEKIEPKGGRVSAEYRKLVCIRLARWFLLSRLGG